MNLFVSSGWATLSLDVSVNARGGDDGAGKQKFIRTHAERVFVAHLFRSSVCPPAAPAASSNSTTEHRHHRQRKSSATISNDISLVFLSLSSENTTCARAREHNEDTITICRPASYLQSSHTIYTHTLNAYNSTYILSGCFVESWSRYML